MEQQVQTNTWLTIKDAIEMVGVCDKTMRNWIKTKKVVGEYSHGLKKWRISKESLLAHIGYERFS